MVSSGPQATVYHHKNNKPKIKSKFTVFNATNSPPASRNPKIVVNDAYNVTST